MNIFRNLAYKLQRMTVGRYGYDELSKALVYVSLAFFVLSAIIRIRIFYTIALVILVYSYFRIFSKNFYKRRAELNKYYAFKRKIAPKISLYKKILAERKTHKYIKCPKCKSIWRYPKRLGKIEITCKKCKNKMIKRV